MIEEVELVDVAKHAHCISAEEVVFELHSDEQTGLTESENKKRTEQFGPNKIPELKRMTALQRLWEQVNSVLIYILIAGAIISFSFHHNIDGFVIIAVCVINITLGFCMESRAVNATETLQKMMSSRAQVMREGVKRLTHSISLALGDIFFLQPGDVIPADGRVLNSSGLYVQEASLTGESHAINKELNPVEESTPLAERHCVVYSGTQVINGTASCVVIATGSECEIGKISQLLAQVKTVKTPLLLQLEVFGRVLSAVIIVTALATFGIAVARGYSIGDGMSTGIGVAVAAIPEGLPSCITVTFAVGVRFMSRKNAIVKSLPAVETLGSVSVICSDKTGTLTMNSMEVKAIALENEIIEISDANMVCSENKDRIMGLILPGLLCNNASIVHTSGPSEPKSNIKSESNDIECGALLEGTTAVEYRIEGSSTEACIMELALKILDKDGAELNRLLKASPKLSEIPFDSKLKYMATMHTMHRTTAERLLLSQKLSEARTEIDTTQDTYTIVFVKGAPEVVLRLCYPDRESQPSSSNKEECRGWLKVMEQCAVKGMRVLGIAMKIVPPDFILSHENTTEMCNQNGGFLLTAMVGIVDPPRPEAIVAVKEANEAGITVKMITGDHPSTALAISEQLGINTAGGVATGTQLDRIITDEENFDKLVLSTDVFARTTPEHKLRIVQSLRRQGIVCSMTGDGVNDAPALKAANIGVAMGITGTDVAKDASNMIITDDNFVTIVDAIKIGRTTYTNLIKIITFVLSANGGQAFSVIIALVFGLAVPITPLQILWVNMLISVTLGIELAFDEPDENIMTTKPRRVDKRIFGKLLGWRISFASVLLVLVVLGIYQWEKLRTNDVVYLRTCSCNAMVISQTVYIFNCRDLRKNISLSKMFFENKLIYIGLVLVGVFQTVFTYTKPFQFLFDVKAIDGESWGKIILLSVCLFIIVELEKCIASLRKSS